MKQELKVRYEQFKHDLESWFADLDREDYVTVMRELATDVDGWVEALREEGEDDI